ncbi:MAG: hypothetical protein K2X87_12580, partial [Gemmataceae bacterium]|nr:hypothetical protein [Gemmataceae bacterium]
LARVAAGDPPGPDDLAALRRRCLALGRITAGVCAACWAVAGLIWPVAMTLWAGWPFGRWAVFLHFWASLTAFGLIAAAYPYYLVTFVAVRVFYPVLLNPVWPTAADRPALDRTDREFGSYSLVAAATLLLAVAGMLLAGGSDAAGYGAALCGVGLATAGLAYAVVGRTRADLAALADIPAPAGR